MQAIVINQYGGPEQFQAMTMPKPTINETEILIVVRAFTINPMDVAGRLGRLGSPFTDHWTFPVVLGWDFAGQVAAVGTQVSQFKVGDAVFGSVPSFHNGKGGTYQEFVTTTPDSLALIPAGVSYEQAATLGIAGITAYQGITESLNVQAGEKVLVQGGAGGVGLFAVQIAKDRGAYVATTCSPTHNELLKQAGADEVFDYHTNDVTTTLSDYDAVFDTAGDLDTGLQVLKADGQLVTVAAQPTEAQQHNQQKQVAFQLTHSTSEDYAKLAQLVADGAIQLSIQTLPFSVASVQKAQTLVEGRHATGKLVIQIPV